MREMALVSCLLPHKWGQIPPSGGVSHQGDKVGEGELEGDVDDLIPPGRAQLWIVVGHEVLEQLFLLVPAAHTWEGTRHVTPRGKAVGSLMA